MTGYILTEQQNLYLTQVLEDLFTETEARACLLSDTGGNIIAQITDTDDEIIQTVAALAAGSFAATKQLAGILGEQSFQSMFHQGHKIAIYIQAISTEFIILAVLGPISTPGLVKLYATKASHELEPLLKEISAQSASAHAKSGQVFETKSDGPIFTPEQR